MENNKLFDYLYYKKKRLILIIGTILAFIVGVYLFFSFTLLTIEAVDDSEQLVRISRDGVKTDELILKSDKKTLLLRSGEYQIEVNGDNMHSVYARSLGGGTRTTVKTELKPQKRLSQIAQHRFDCSSSNGSVVVYPCSNYQSEVYRKTSTGFALEINPIGINTETEESSESVGITAAIKPFLDGYISFVSRNNQLHITARSSDGKVNNENKTVVENYTGILDQQKIATIDSATSSAFSVINSSNKQLYLFSSIESEPKIIDLSNDIPALEETETIEIALSDSAVFVFVRQVSDLIELHDNDATQQTFDELRTRQKILQYDNNGERIHSIPFDSRTLVNQFFVNESGKILLLPFRGDANQVHVSEKDQLLPVLLPHDDINNVCWKNENTFYYSSLSANQIYEYNINNQSAHMVYSNARGSIRSMRCTHGELYVVMSNPRVGSRDLDHYIVSDETSRGARIENILPLYVNIGPDTLKLTLSGTKILVEQAHDGDSNPATPTKQKAKEEILDRLNGRSIETNNLEFLYDF